MPADATLSFGPYRLDLDDESLWDGRSRIQLAPKAFSVLACLVAHAGTLVTKEDLFDAVWPDTAVGDAALTFSIGEIRRALGDDARSPRYIETVHRRGYRFIAELASVPESASTTAGQGQGEQPLAALVGRGSEVSRLREHFEEVSKGRRRVVLIGGEPGIGKSALTDAFVDSLARDGSATIARGQCIEQYGTGEPYLPVLEALTRLCKGSDGPALRERIVRSAPGWLLQMPSIATTEELAEAKQRNEGVGGDRLLREVIDLLEEAASEQPLVLVLEDLHWSDTSTVELLGALARRRYPTKLLIIGTYRPVDVIALDHPLRTLQRDLVAQGRINELLLDYLAPVDVERYLASRLTDKGIDSGAISRTIHRHTEGNPLFMVALVDHLLASAPKNGLKHLLLEGDAALEIPATLSSMLDQRIDSLTEDERRILQAAAVVGHRFSATALAAAIGVPVESAEESCEALAHGRKLIKRDGQASWPDGSVSSSYAFMHVLYQQVLYDRLGSVARVELHRRVAERIQAGYADNTAAAAAVLAAHFDAAGDTERAYHRHREAAEQAVERGAGTEACAHLTRALECLALLDDKDQRLEEELWIQVHYGMSIVAIKGYAATECSQAFARAGEIAEQLGRDDLPHLLYPAHWTAALSQGRYDDADLITSKHFSMAQESASQHALGWAHFGRGNVCLYTGRFNDAGKHYEAVLSSPPAGPAETDSIYRSVPLDPTIAAAADLAWVQWYLGNPIEARSAMEQALKRIDSSANALTAGYVLTGDATLARLEDDPDRALEAGERLASLAEEHRLSHYRITVDLLRGWAIARAGDHERGTAMVRASIAAHREAGATMSLTMYYATLAHCCLAVDNYAKATEAIDAGIAQVGATGERYHHSELLRLRGEVELRTGGRTPLAQDSLQRAVEVAVEQGAKAWKDLAERSLHNTNVGDK